MRFKVLARFAALALASLALMPTSAYAVSAQVKRACKSDYLRLCPSYKVGTSALRACMQSNANLITPGCVQALIDSGEVRRGRR